MEAVRSHALREYPSECCGMILSDARGGAARYRACTNAQDRYHALDPQNFPRDSRTAYCIEPGELLRLERECRERDERIAVICHSHIDTGAYFSEEDVRRATFDAPPEPIRPGVDHLVVAVASREGRTAVTEEKLFRWNEESRTFVEVPVEEGA